LRAANVHPVCAEGIRPQGRSHVIVFGNEKGGSGKSTIAMHLMVALIKRGFNVASIDLDASQGTLSRYIENRCAYGERVGLQLDLPEHRRIYRSDQAVRSAAEREEHAKLKTTFSELSDRDFVVIDTPGSNNYLLRLGHGYADTLVTPLNDSFVDLDLLARIDAEGRKVLALSSYSQMVLEQRQERALAGRRPLDWIVMRNRLTHIDAHNKREITCIMEQLSHRLQFRTTSGFGERVVFRELFLKGLTLLDLHEDASDIALTMSHVAARQEVRALMQAIALPLQKETASGETESVTGGAAPKKDGKNRSWVARAFSRARRSAVAESRNSS
jgi:chromosome partitioning protein